LLRLTLLFLIAACAAQAARVPFTPDDWWAWRSVAAARITADGEWVVYAESWNDRTADAAFSNLWVVSANGRTRRQFTNGPWRDTSPRWSPDGARIAWISDRGGKPQIWVRPFESGAETQITSLETPPLAFAWSPDGASLAFTALAPDGGTPPSWAPPEILPRLRRPREGRVQLFVVKASGGASRAIAAGSFDYLGEPAWTPDSRSILAARDDGGIYAIRVADGVAKLLTPAGTSNQNPVVASDSGKIAFLTVEAKHLDYVPRKVAVMNPDGSRLKVLTGSLDLEATDPQWSSDSRTVYFLAAGRGAGHAYAARNDGTVRQVTSAAERLSGFSLADSGRAVAVRSAAADSGSLFTFTVDRVSQPSVLADPNEHLLAEREIASAEEIAYSSAGNTIQAWLIRPPGFDASRKYPLVVDVRDHPRAMYGIDFNLRAQVLAGAGFLVLCANPRGTPGYGEVFGNLLPTRNPGDDFDDLMQGLDLVISKGFVDSGRVFLAGGPLAAWTIVHSPRFRSVIVRHPGLNPGYTPPTIAQNFESGVLLLADDLDVPAEITYAALHAQKVDAAFVRVGAAKPSAKALELEAILGWLKR
jgi:dipeptidyl aminopeptidase/acylaminoacyl peptidase